MPKKHYYKISKKDRPHRDESSSPDEEKPSKRAGKETTKKKSHESRREKWERKKSSKIQADKSNTISDGVTSPHKEDCCTSSVTRCMQCVSIREPEGEEECKTEVTSE